MRTSEPTTSTGLLERSEIPEQNIYAMLRNQLTLEDLVSLAWEAVWFVVDRTTGTPFGIRADITRERITKIVREALAR